MTVSPVADEQQLAWLARSLGRSDLAPLDPNDIDELSAEFGAMAYAGGTYIYREGQAPTHVHIVRRGTVELSRRRDGRRAVLSLAHRGDVLGDVPLFLRQMTPCDASALNDCQILSIDSVALMRLLEQRPHLSRRWLVSLSSRIMSYEDRVSDLLSGSLEGQIASFLLHEGRAGPVRISQQTLAQLLGARRTSVNQTLRSLEQRGLVTLGYRCLEIRDRNGLRDLLGS